MLKDDQGNTVLEIGQEFAASELRLDIETKEAMGVVRTLIGIAEVKGWDFLAGKRLNCWIDNAPLVFCLAKGASRNIDTHAQLEYLFWMKLRHHFAITAIWWNTSDNYEADAITRVDKADDWKLLSWVFRDLWERWGPINMDLMASAVNVQSDLQGVRLPFFSRFHCPGSSGVDLLAQIVPQGQHYCFPHPRMVKAAGHHVRRFRGVAMLLVVQASDVSWMPQVRGKIAESINMPPRSIVTLKGDVVPVDFRAFRLVF